jgi:hypothetical protein
MGRLILFLAGVLGTWWVLANHSAVLPAGLLFVAVWGFLTVSRNWNAGKR